MFEEYRLHSKKEEDLKNSVPKRVVVKGVLLQQAVQAMVAILMFKVTESDGAATLAPEVQPSYIVLARQFLVAMFVYMAVLPSQIHAPQQVLVQAPPLMAPPPSRALLIRRPVQPPTGGAPLGHLRRSPIILDIGMSPKAAIVFFSFSAIKGIDDHCGLWLPWNPFQVLFANNVAYHDVHHQLYGNKHNFSQPSFVVWDKIMGTQLPYSLEKRREGGFMARPVKD
ncbi:Sphinganine C(4)-monooxygenase 2 [Acorus calamus]|uniref:aldehyde oxygenase (deformylating) n=1 Tax=Acorus calamus TaxID=4465 RepID=A0AAV9CNK6_ACOCL|nr:Sphinganine C(4)-monooxygenase 2 [Acorus calamus]